MPVWIPRCMQGSVSVTHTLHEYFINQSVLMYVWWKAFRVSMWHVRNMHWFQTISPLRHCSSMECTKFCYQYGHYCVLLDIHWFVHIHALFSFKQISLRFHWEIGLKSFSTLWAVALQPGGNAQRHLRAVHQLCVFFFFCVWDWGAALSPSFILCAQVNYLVGTSYYLVGTSYYLVGTRWLCHIIYYADTKLFPEDR